MEKENFISASAIICFIINIMQKLKLGNDHKAYRVYIACRQDLGSAANWTNMGKCTHWGVEAVSNCHF